ncbi:MAG TPA: dihydroorotate dehydrogenase, partial [Blastocatellia bacterium]|nr:dihydroorotate dehydrogenase [Blastocatellia bacterium]
RRCFLGITFPTAVGCGPGLDAEAVALPALARFGCGFLEVGPVTVAATGNTQIIERQPEREAIWFPDPPTSLGLQSLAPRLAEASRLGIPLIARLGYTADAIPEQTAEECRQMIQELAPDVQLFSLLTPRLALTGGWSDEEWITHLYQVLAAARSASPPRPLLLCLPADLDVEQAARFFEPALAAGVAGLLVDGSVREEPEGRLIGLPARQPALALVRSLRQSCGRDALIIGSGGVHQPEHALELLAAGADLLQVDSGLVYSGPGLPKRINDALLYVASRRENAPPTPEPLPRPTEMTWFWTALLGAGMLFGSLLALAIAATQVVLPYDESFVGMTREELARVNPRLLAFMTHDRVTLAGAMVAIGALYLGLSLYGIRKGLHWAQQTVFVSAFTGFASFFLFLGFGYLDPFHAFVTAALLQLLLLGVHSRLGPYTPTVAPYLRGDRAWRMSLWGQLLLVIHGFGLLAAGLVISVIGVTQVFVREDLGFMQTTAEALRSANPRLVPLVAHDRATLGGMLLASGWACLLPALWGYRNGSPWLWWTLLIAGLSAYSSAIGVHYAVGYTDMGHLLPAFAGLGIFVLGLGLSHAYLCGGGQGSEAEWRHLGIHPRARSAYQ